MSHLLMAIDIGTSGTKITLFNFQGQVVCSYLGEYKTYYPETGQAEHKPESWWQVICEGIKYFKDKENVNLADIAAIGVDGLSWAGLPVDENGNPLRNVMIWLDRRAEEQARWMKEQVGEKKLVKLSGNPVDPAYITPKMLWIKEHEPDIYKKTYKFLQSNSFIVYKLTGQFTQDYSQGYGFHFFDIEEGNWDQQTAEQLGLSLDKVAPLYNCHQVVGTVTKKAARQTGLVSGIPVVAGGLDAACCSLGAGVIKPGLTQEQGGQAGGMSIQLGEPVIHPDLILGYHVLPDQWLLQGGTVGGGGVLRWFNRELGAREKKLAEQRGIKSYQVMDEEAAKIAPGSDGLLFLPYMSGERSPIWNSKARGIFFGLSYDKTRGHLIRAMMEGVGFSLLHNLKTAKEVDVEIKKLNSVGGAASSRVWTQMKADITGYKINVPSSNHATALGAAILAGVGAGVYEDFAEAVEQTINIQRAHTPDCRNHKIYQEYFQLYIELYNKLESSFDSLYQLS
ncbi:MAG: xylulokinase [Halanaerobiaceae bacterium]